MQLDPSNIRFLHKISETSGKFGSRNSGRLFSPALYYVKKSEVRVNLFLESMKNEFKELP